MSVMRPTQLAIRRVLTIAAICFAASCAPKAPPPQPTPAGPPPITIDQKLGWIVRLEQQRVLRDPSVGADLIALLGDADGNVKRRAALALGRVGAVEGVDPLIAALGRPDENIRATAAFALGLLGNVKAIAPLTTALQDPAAQVRGRSAEALGLIASTTPPPPAESLAPVAAAIATAAGPCPALIAPIVPDDETTKTAEVEACRLSILALVRLRQYDALARVVLDGQGRPVSQWWPVAFALQRSGDARAADALASLATVSGVYTPAFALRGLASLKDARVVQLALALASRGDLDVKLRAVAIRTLGQMADPRALQPLMTIALGRGVPQNLVLEALAAIGPGADQRMFSRILDLFAAPSPAVRAAAMATAARIDVDGFLLAISSVERDRDWSVRAALARILATLPAESVRGAVEDLAKDEDVRVRAAGLRALVDVGGIDPDRHLFDALTSPDFGLRSTAAELIGQRRPPDAVARLVAAYTLGQADATYSARAAAVDAIGRYTTADVVPALTAALNDKEWPVRLRAAALLRQHGVPDAAPVRPAPLQHDAAFYESDRVLHPKYSPQAYIETAAGTIQIELDVLDAPLTTLAFIELARAGFFNGIKVHRLIPNFVIQAGDPRGDGEGGPGYSIRDELGTRTYVRGTVGMALAGPDTGGSQFFITVSPQPHLDGRYTVFGKVVRGMELLDGISLGDVIVRIRIDDGT